MQKLTDLTGLTFGKLKVLRKGEPYVRKDGKRETRWLCECKCKAKTLRNVRGSDLKNGHTKSCGCTRAKSLRDRNKKNEYSLSGNTVTVKMSNSNNEMLCDNSFWEKYKDSSWSEDVTTGYARASRDGGVVYAHRIIMPDSDKDKYVDHINGNKLDNRRINLRYVTPKQSMMNISRSDSNTGIKGVHLNKNTEKYEAYIHDEEKLHLGTFETLSEARRVREKAEVKLYGEHGELLSR